MRIPRLGALAAAAGGYAMLVRPRMLRWGATEDEVARALPGDEIVPVPRYQSTRGITIRASTGDVWPWLMQMGQGRGGMYSYDWLENIFGCEIHSADRIHPEWQDLRAGDEIRLYPPQEEGPDVAMEVARIDYERALVLRSKGSRTSVLEQGLPFTTWAFVLEPLSAESTRLLVRMRAEFEPTAAGVLKNQVLLEPIHFVMEERMLRGLKERAEGYVAAQRLVAEPTAKVH